MKKIEVYNLRINGYIASGIVNGIRYRFIFDFIPTEKIAKMAIKKAAKANG